jgi:hypothetical protein
VQEMSSLRLVCSCLLNSRPGEGEEMQPLLKDNQHQVLSLQHSSSRVAGEVDEEEGGGHVGGGRTEQIAEGEGEHVIEREEQDMEGGEQGAERGGYAAGGQDEQAADKQKQDAETREYEAGKHRERIATSMVDAVIAQVRSALIMAEEVGH